MQTVANPELATRTALSFPAEPASATRARRFVTGVLGSVVGDDVVDVAALLTTELAANSVIHAGSAIDVEISVGEEQVTVLVADTQPGHPTRIEADVEGTFGRGLLLVDRLSDRWGVSPRAAGKVVWFSLTR